MNTVTIVLPVSRDEYLPRLFASLEMLTCDRNKTNLLVIVDGKTELFVKVRNLVQETKFREKLCIYFKSEHEIKHFDIGQRRLRISDIHNEIKQHLWNCEYVFGIEDDTLVPTNALDKLLKDFLIYPHAGFIEGVELGRWGVPYVGAWRSDDIYDPKEIKSILKKEQIEPIDAGGFYCFLSRLDTYESHDFKPYQNVLGPDVNYGMALRTQGYENYIDWSIGCIHLNKDKEISLFNTSPRVITFKKNNKRWSQIIDRSI